MVKNKFSVKNFTQELSSSQEYQSAESPTENEDKEEDCRLTDIEKDFTDGVNSEDYSAKAQEVRSLMRERFLRAITNFAGRKCEASMYGVSSTVTGEFCAMDASGTHVCVKDLNTASGHYNYALLRTREIMWLNISGKSSDLHKEEGDTNKEKETVTL